MKKAAIVIPNWNGKEDTLLCLESLKKAAKLSAVTVIDNGSVDGSVEAVKRSFEEVAIIEHSRNLGFAGGVNAGIKKALADGYDFVVLLNNDALVEKDWLKHLLARINSQEDIGIVTSKILLADREHIDSTGDFLTRWLLPFPRGRGEVDTGQFSAAQEVTCASGGASIYKVSMLKEIGLFDEDFFAYYEDVDISLRARLAGWKVVYEPKPLSITNKGLPAQKSKVLQPTIPSRIYRFLG